MGKFDSEIKNATAKYGRDGPKPVPARGQKKPARGRPRTMPGEHIFRQTLKGALKLNRRLERNFMHKKGGDSLLAAKQMFTLHYNHARAFEQQFKDIYNQDADVELVFPHEDPFCFEAEAERAEREAEEKEALRQKAAEKAE